MTASPTVFEPSRCCYNCLFMLLQLLDPIVHPGQFLVKLNLSKCNLGEAGGLAIAAALRAGNLELRVLFMTHNR